MDEISGEMSLIPALIDGLQRLSAIIQPIIIQAGTERRKGRSACEEVMSSADMAAVASEEAKAAPVPDMFDLYLVNLDDQDLTESECVESPPKCVIPTASASCQSDSELSCRKFKFYPGLIQRREAKRMEKGKVGPGRILEKVFQIQSHLSQAEIVTLADACRISRRQISCWFYKRRKRATREARNKSTRL